MNIISKLAILWWIPYILRKSACLLSKIKHIYHKNKLKFGIEVPRNYAEATKMDISNDNTSWQDALNK